MEQSILGAVAQSGAFGAMLFAVLYWLARYYLPLQERSQREALDRITRAHEASLARLTEALERNTRILALCSQALLVQSLSRSSRSALSREEAQALIQRFELTLLGSTDHEAVTEHRAA